MKEKKEITIKFENDYEFEKKIRYNSNILKGKNEEKEEKNKKTGGARKEVKKG